MQMPAFFRTISRAAATTGLVAVLFTLPASAASEVTAVTSPGGITAWLVTDETVPLVAVDFAFRGGASQDPADKPGVANLLSTLLDEGAGDLDSAAFQLKLDETAVQIGFSADHDAFNGSLATLSTRKAEAFDLLALALGKPRFDAEPIERMREAIISNLRGNETDPDHIASVLFAEKTFPGHPYGRPDDGTPETLAAITRDDVVRFHAEKLARDNLVIGVVGDISAEELKPLLDKAFGGLPAKANLVPVPEAVPSTGLSLNETVNEPQTVIRFAAPGLKRDDRDFMAAFVMNHILGGGTFSSRLYNEIREKRGLAYSVWSALAAYDRAGLFLAGTSTRAEKAAESERIMREEIARMAADGPTAKELEDAKTYLTGNYALRFDSSGKIAEQLVGLQLDRLPINYFQTRNALIDAVTLDDVKRVAKRILGQPLTVVTVGPASG